MRDACYQKLEWTPAEGGLWRRTARCTRPVGHAGPHNGQGYTWGKFGTPPEGGDPELETLRAFALSRRGEFADWLIARVLGEDGAS